MTRRAAAGWPLLGAASVLPVVGLGWLHPVLPLAAPAAVVVGLLAAFRPKPFAVLALAVIGLSVPIQNLAGPAGGFADEAMVAVLVVALGTRRLVTRGGLAGLPGLGWFAAFAALGVASALVRDAPAGVWLPAAVIALKAVLVGFALAQLDWTAGDLRTAARLGAVVVAGLAATALANLAAPGPWAALTTARPPLTYVAGLPSLNGPFQHPAALSRLCVLLAVGAAAHLLVVRRTAAGLVLVAVPAVLVVLTFQVKSLVALIVVVGLLALRYARPAGLVAGLAAAPLLAVVALPPLVALVAADVRLYFLSESARLTLVAGSLDVAERYLPLGAGFGRYGSATAASNYSPEYYRLGFDSVFGLGPGEAGRFLNDNQWPAILGETGMLGAAAFALGVAVALASLRRPVGPGEPAEVRWLRVAGAGWIVALLVESVASPVFVSAPAYPFLLGAVGVVAALRRAARPVPISSIHSSSRAGYTAAAE